MSYYNKLCELVPVDQTNNKTLMEYIEAISQKMENYCLQGKSDDIMDKLFKDAQAHVRATVHYRKIKESL